MMHCKNYEICSNTYPVEYHKCWGDTCLNCDMHFGNWRNDGSDGLSFKDGVECCVCMEEGLKGVKWAKCKHYTCIVCFKEMWKVTLNPDSYVLKDLPNELPKNKEIIDGMITRMRLKNRSINEESEDTIYEDVNEFYKECILDEKIYRKGNLECCPLCRR